MWLRQSTKCILRRELRLHPRRIAPHEPRDPRDQQRARRHVHGRRHGDAKTQARALSDVADDDGRGSTAAEPAHHVHESRRRAARLRPDHVKHRSKNVRIIQALEKSPGD
jgi:hypothetical protein